MSRSLRRFLPALALLALACDGTTDPEGPAPVRGFVVLNGFGQQGVTLVPDTGSSTSRIDFGASFDGGSMTVRSDTVLSTSSRSGGDQLYVASLPSGSLLRVQMPAGSNPAGAAFVGQNNVAIAVALRDSQSVALVASPVAASPNLTFLRNAGTCPSAVARYGNAYWVFDSNQLCRTNYAIQGPARLIRITDAGARDTLVLGNGRGGGSITIVGSTAYVTTAGEVNFSTNTLVQSGTVFRVNLDTRTIISTLPMPQGTYGAALRVGGNGRLYVTAYGNIQSYPSRVFAIDPSTMAFAGPFATGAQNLNLVKTGGATPNCGGGATADDAGRVYCVENGAGSVATMLVFDAAGQQLRTVAVGQGAVDIALRR